jgi:SAM-dependent methyltransferase
VTTTTQIEAREAFADRLVEGVTHAMETISVHLGLELGLYRTIADVKSATPAEMGRRAGIAARYAREWLEQQAVAGYLICENQAEPPEHRRYRLPEEHRDVLVVEDSPYFAAPLTQQFAGITAVLPQLLAAYRTGAGVPFSAYGRDIRAGIAAGNRPMFLHELAATWMPAMPEVHHRLLAAPPARVLDLGCGLGASSFALAAAYPQISVLGVDLDAASVVEARTASVEAGVANRVTFVVGEVADVAGVGPFELVTMFEALHDMADPRAVLRSAGEVLSEGGSVLIADERVADSFSAPGDLTERLMYGWSILHCLPATLAEGSLEANGTVLRAPTVAGWAADAGFADCQILPIENPFWRFYQLSGYGRS